MNEPEQATHAEKLLRVEFALAKLRNIQTFMDLERAEADHETAHLDGWRCDHPGAIRSMQAEWKAEADKLELLLALPHAWRA